MNSKDLKKGIEKNIFFAGISLSNSINYDSGIAIIDKNKKIITLDKFYNTEDLNIFLKNYNSLKETLFCVSIPSDGTMLDGKWRIHSKNYRMLGDRFEINKNNWTNRLSSRGNDVLIKYKELGMVYYRYDIGQLRLAYDLMPTYSLRSSLDCKGVQTALKLKYNFKQLPDNMLPASNFEAILGAMFAYDIANGCEINKVATFNDSDVLYKAM
ncbi:MAG: hypothetical protein E7Z91_00930 [Cyanobacteria bacterium SIG30]|nr:hypothetical protein [Cyanobacteria bacterium SIG30]